MEQVRTGPCKSIVQHPEHFRLFMDVIIYRPPAGLDEAKTRDQEKDSLYEKLPTDKLEIYAERG